MFLIDTDVLSPYADVNAILRLSAGSKARGRQTCS